MRTFVAIELDLSIKNNLLKFLRKLETGSKSVRWVKPQGMHLTLKFLGETPEKKIDQVKAVLDQIMKDYPPFLLRLKGTGSFPPRSKIPRVLWVGVEHEGTLDKIQIRLENEMEKLHFPKEKRQYHPHLTLGRIKTPQNLASLLTLLQEHEKKDFGEMMVDKITFFQSILKPTGAEYLTISEHRLG